MTMMSPNINVIITLDAHAHPSSSAILLATEEVTTYRTILGVVFKSKCNPAATMIGMFWISRA